MRKHPSAYHFKSREAERKWNAYRYMHIEGKPHRHKEVPIYIRGKCVNCGNKAVHHHGRHGCCGMLGCHYLINRNHGIAGEFL